MIPNEKEDSENLNDVGEKENGNVDFKGVVVDNEEAAYNFYNDYGYRMGFSVRRGKNRYFAGTKDIRCKDFYCVKEGFQEFEDAGGMKQYNKLETRTGCPAMIRFTVKDNRWTVTHFISKHNHVLATPSKRHLLRSARSLPTAKANVISSMVTAGIRPVDVYSYMSNEAGGSENIGFTKRDCYNYVNKQKMMIIEAGDGQSLLDHFKVRASEDPMFFYTVQVDQENRMTNFFWRDGRARIDYDCFGDVMVFDTTYRTNRYNLICAPFVGINHHRQTIMFGCAFLLDETAASFAWLFKSFLQAMGNQSPKTIMTDQDHAISKAICEVFPDSCHRLCQWHISKNAPSHLGSLNTNADFHALFQKCIQGCESETEFEETWTKMINDHKLEDHTWLKGLYKCRKKWSTAFSNDIFSSEIKSSQRAEVTNNVLKGISKATTSLTEFILEFENLVARWRSTEGENDFQCKNGSITLAVKNSGILIHASKVYTHEIFKRFQLEFLDGIPLTWREVGQDGENYTFEVMIEQNNSRVRMVQFNTSTMEIHCSCKKFSICGYLCSHALRILSVKNVSKIPQQYISKRWTKEAKKNVHGRNASEISQHHTSEADIEIVFRNRMTRFAYDFIIKSQKNEKTRQLCQKVLYEGDLEVEKELTKLCVDKDQKEATKSKIRSKNVRRSIIEDLSENADEVVKESENNCSPILDPPRVRPKGVSNARLKGYIEKRKSKASKSTTQKKIKQSKTGQSLDAPRTGQSIDAPFESTPSLSNFINPSMIMPTNSIYGPPYQNTMQICDTGARSRWYSSGINLPYGIVPQTNSATTTNLNQDSSKHGQGHLGSK